MEELTSGRYGIVYQEYIPDKPQNIPSWAYWHTGLVKIKK